MGEMADYYMEQEINEAMRECHGDMRFYEGPVTDELILANPEIDLVGNQRRREEREREPSLTRRPTKSAAIRMALSYGTYWINQAGRKVKVEKIRPRYARNIMRWLEKCAPKLHEDAVIEACSMPMPDVGTVAYDDVDAGINTLMNESPLEWVHNQALWRALQKRAEEGR